MKRFLTLAMVCIAGAGTSSLFGAIKAVIIDGQNNHNWKQTTPALKRILESSKLFSVDVRTSSAEGTDEGFKPKFKDYQVVVLNYNGADWPKETQDAFVEYVSNGGGVVVYHAADNSFGSWQQYNEIIGIGGWGGRDEKSGPMVRWRDGKMALDTTPGTGGSHGPRHDYKVEVRTDHPIVAGLPSAWMHASDELYSKLRGPAKNLTVLATAYSSAKSKKGTGENEPMLMVIDYGKGRVFHTALGHDLYSMASRDFEVTLVRGAEWAATGKVSDTSCPADFPTAEKISVAYLDGLFAKLMTYDYNDSRLVLSEIEEFVRDGRGPSAAIVEEKLIAVLKGNSTAPAKQFACRQLRMIGTDASIEVLSEMVIKPETADFARYALEGIKTKAANEALIKALGQAKSDQKVGIINVLGARRCSEAVAVLAELAGQNDKAVSNAAIGNLGLIGNDECAKTLIKLLETASSEQKQIIAAALADCAESMIKAGQNENAGEIGKKLAGQDMPEAAKIAAVRIAIVTAQDPGKVIAEQVGSSDAKLAAAAVRTMHQVKLASVDEIAKKLASVAPATQVQLIAAFAERKDTGAHDAVAEMAKSDNADVKDAALKALAKIGSEKDLMMLAETAAGKSDAAQTARDTMNSVQGQGFESAMIAAVKDAQGPVQIEMIRSMATRNMESARTVLMELCGSADGKIRAESLRALRNVGGAELMPALAGMLVGAKASDREEIEKTIVAIGLKMSKAGERAKALLAAWPVQKDVDVKVSMLNVFGKMGDPESLDEIKTSLNDPDARIKDAAARAISEWPEATVIEDLLALAKSTNIKHHVFGLRGYVRLLGLDESSPVSKMIEAYKGAMALAANDSEKKLVLGGVGKLKGIEALQMAQDYVETPELKAEAAAAIVNISEYTFESDPKPTMTALKKAIDIVNGDSRKKAQKLYKHLESTVKN